MAKAYWITFYRQIKDPDKLAAYAKIAGPAITAGGGKFLARGIAEQAYEGSLKERTTLIEFPSMEAAVAAHDGAAYKEALKALDGSVEREIRLISAAE